MKRVFAAAAVLALLAGCGPEQTTTKGTVTVTGEGNSPVSPTPAPSPDAVCSCSGDTKNCSSFSSSSAAQACYDYCVSQGVGDVHRLDSDHDGKACEG